MIMNPALSGGGTEKEYKITNGTYGNFTIQDSAKAGEFVVAEKTVIGALYMEVTTEDGESVPVAIGEDGGTDPSALFVMPSKNVVVKRIR